MYFPIRSGHLAGKFFHNYGYAHSIQDPLYSVLKWVPAAGAWQPVPLLYHCRVNLWCKVDDGSIQWSIFVYSQIGPSLAKQPADQGYHTNGYYHSPIHMSPGLQNEHLHNYRSN